MLIFITRVDKILRNLNVIWLSTAQENESVKNFFKKPAAIPNRIAVTPIILAIHTAKALRNFVLLSLQHVLCVRVICGFTPS